MNGAQLHDVVGKVVVNGNRVRNARKPRALAGLHAALRLGRGIGIALLAVLLSLAIWSAAIFLAWLALVLLGFVNP